MGDTEVEVGKDQRWPRALPTQGQSQIQERLDSAARMAAVHRSELLDTPAEESFDALTRLAVRLLGVPSAFVSVLAAERDFYKSQAGFPAPLADARELRGRTFCHYTLAGDDVLVIDDTHQHPVWRAVPTVETMGVRAYVGVPIQLDRETIGSFCVIDDRPRHWTSDELETLYQLGVSASREISLRSALATARLEVEASNAMARAREEILAVVAHDLRTPLQVLALGTHVVQKALAGREETTTARMTRAIQAMKSMADALLSSSALAAPSATGRQSFDGAQLARDAVSLMAPIAERADITLTLHELPSAPVFIDYGQMLRVLGNLIGNAVKYSPAGSVVGIGGRLADGGLALDVRDNGKGMTAEEQARAFERGWQGSDGMVRGDGAGLGLAIARTMVEQHDGRIAMSDAIGGGLIVTVWLPVLAAHAG